MSSEGNTTDACYISLEDVRRELDIRVSEYVDAVADRWRATMTRDYVRNKIIEAETSNNRSVLLIEEDAKTNIDYRRILTDLVGKRTESIASMVFNYFSEYERARYTLTAQNLRSPPRVQVTLDWFNFDEWRRDPVVLSDCKDCVGCSCACCIFCVLPLMLLCTFCK